MNPIFQMMGGANNSMPFGGPAQMKQQFTQFMQQNQNGNPNQILQQLMQSGRVNQAMVNQAQQMANMFGQFLK